ncbi:MAG: hypothetical protein WAW85_05835 [Gordonia sp. (in: high G+C Gram-positive bacteria)]
MRSTVGRLNDVVHAAAIVQVLTKILEPGERVADECGAIVCGGGAVPT